MGGFSSLEIGKRALQAQQYALDTTSNNVANVNTKGYSRRTVVMSESLPLNQGGHLKGSGVMVSKLQNYRQEFFDREVRTTQSGLSGAQIDVRYLARMETILAEPSENGLNELITEFFNSFTEMTQNPEHVGLRTNIISQTKNIAERFNSTAEKMLDARTEAFREVESSLKEVNTLISEIASLNREIVNSKVQTNNETQTLSDQREVKLEELSEFMETKVTFDEDGSANVFINGMNVVTNVQFSTLEAFSSSNTVTGEQTAYIRIKESGNTIDTSNGEIGSLLNHFNTTLDDKDSSGQFSIATELSNFANTFASKVNEIAVQGYGLNDNGTTPPGYTFFEPSDGSLDAFSMKISDDINGKPENIPLSDKPGEPGNSTIASQMARLAEDNTAMNNQTFAEYYANLLSRLGSASSGAQNKESTTSLIYDQLNSERDAVLGVNLDEEAINLVKYQKAFEASSQAIAITNELLTTLVNIVR